MPPQSYPEIDWEKGCVFVQDGHLYVSPNCQRDVHIPPIPQGNPPDPFAAKVNLKAEDFKQPIWWNDMDGWKSFIPLSPSYIPSPFNVLSWMPQFDSSGWKGLTNYQMRTDDTMQWMDRETRIVEAVIRLRNVFKIPAKLPPRPSENFKIDKAYPSKEAAKAAAEGCRDWFAIWMGMLSFCIALSETTTMFRDESAESGPLWYQKLYAWDPKQWPQSWLDGIRGSCVCQYDDSVARAGIVLDLSSAERGRPDVRWFLEHGIPVFYPWRATEEYRSISREPSLSALRPPTPMITNALSALFSTSTLPMSALVAHNYYLPRDSVDIQAGANFLRYAETTDVVKGIIENTLAKDLCTLRKLMEEPIDVLKTELQVVLEEQQRTVSHRAQCAANFPTQGMVDEQDWRTRGRLVEDIGLFFEQRAQCHAELMLSETTDRHHSRIQRERHPGIKQSDVYEWHRVETSGGKVLYARVLTYKKYNADIIARYPKSQRIYDAFSNVWDLCEFLEHSGPYPHVDESEELVDKYGTDNQSDSPPPLPPLQKEPQIPSQREPERPPPVQMPPGQPARILSTDNPLSLRRPETRTEWEELEKHVQESYSPGGSFPWDRRDLVEFLHLAYGYVPPVGHSTGETVDDTTWKIMVRKMGYKGENESGATIVTAGDQNDVQRFFLAMSARSDAEMTIPPELFDLSPMRRPDTLRRLNYQVIHRPAKNLYVFSDPRSMAVDWMLGVESAEVAMYCMRYFAAHDTHTILNLLSRLVCQGVKCRTLLGLRLSSRNLNVQTVVGAFEPTGFRSHKYVFTKEDFEAWINTVEELLRTPRFRAGLLMGGIVGRICRAFMNLDSVLQGPSYEVTSCRVGFIVPVDSEGHIYGDDELTEHDLAKICGAYTVYNEERRQTGVRYWFPPNRVWSSQSCGHSWMEWTEINEEWFNKLWAGYEDGTGGQPRSAEMWSSSLRGLAASRIFQSRSKEFAQAFCDENISPKLSLPPRSLLDRIEK